MLEKKSSRLKLIVSIVSLFSMLFISCGDDNPVKTEVTPGLQSVSGFYFKAVMGATNNIEFTLGSSDKTPLANQWIHFTALVGDGTLVNDSVLTDSKGAATCLYIFNGNLGEAEIQALVRNIDTTTVTLRANTLIPGTNGQAQYILMQDQYSDIKNFNGLPASIDLVAGFWILVANYEAELGVVFVMEDVNRDEVLVDSAKILSIIVNTVYSGKTKDSIGIGSTLADVFAVYTDSVVTDDGSAFYYEYPASGIAFWTDTASTVLDREVFEIHISDNAPIPAINPVQIGDKAKYIKHKK